MIMKSDIDLLRKILLLSYHLLDEKDAVTFDDINDAPELEGYDRQSIVDALNRISRNKFVVLQPTFRGDRQPLIVYVTYNGCMFVRNME